MLFFAWKRIQHFWCLKCLDFQCHFVKLSMSSFSVPNFRASGMHSLYCIDHAAYYMLHIIFNTFPKLSKDYMNKPLARSQLWLNRMEPLHLILFSLEVRSR